MKMNKKILSAAVLATFSAGSAQAVSLGEDGLGQVLLFPYYTVQGNEETLLTVVNTTDQSKIVKIRFREAYNSREVLDFNIYMSPRDVWTGKVKDSGDGAGIVTYDNTCTVPELPAGTVIPFRTYNYDGSKAATHPQDGAPTGVERTREGYVEIIEMGVPDLAAGTLNAVWNRSGPNGAPSGDLDNVHVSGVPERCATFIENWQAGGAWAVNAADAVAAPIGGLFGSLAIINIQSGTEVAVAATALNNVFDAQTHADPGSNDPTLGAAVPISEVVDDTNGPGGNAIVLDNWGAGAGIDAVSAVLMASTVINEYSVNPAVEAESAWIVTFPTKWAYVDHVNNVVIDPFQQSFFLPDDANGNHVGRGKSCDDMNAVAYDREEFSKKAGLDFSPRPPGGGFALCYEANVLQFGDSDVFSAENTESFLNNPPGKNGWLSLSPSAAPAGSTYHTMVGPTSGLTYHGLPVIGFKATVLGNSTVGVGASYATGVAHAYERVRTQ